MTNTSASAGLQKINELKNELTELAEDLNRVEYTCTTQEHELKTLSDHMCDLNSLKESVKASGKYIKSLFYFTINVILVAFITGSH